MKQEVLKEALFDEVFHSQKNFRVLMDGMSRPGKIFKLNKHCFSKSPEGFNANVLTILKTLGDNNVTFSMGNFKSDVLQRYIEVNTGMVSVESNEAYYVLFDWEEFDKNICYINTGTLEFPENSATVIISAESILNGQYEGRFIDNVEIHMTGPGIKDINTVTIVGLDKNYIKSIVEANSVFPLGIDAIFVDNEGNIACMPRTTKAEVK
jgi:alpha-D-ribose 1-methylphosphonate 5-triphosphate synthase subunit PhnH